RLVELAVVPPGDGDPVTEAVGGDPTARFRLLLGAERDAEAVGTETAGRVHEQAPPAAADVEQASSLAQAQLLAEMIELALLRGVDVLLGAAEVAARVDHLLAEPQLEELVAEVVVDGDVPTGLLERMRAPPAEEQEPGLLGRAQRERLRATHEHEAEESLEVALHVDGARDVRVAEAEAQVAEEAPAR